MMHYTDDPIRDAENYQADQERRLESRPVCDICNQPIMDEYIYHVDEYAVCEECALEYLKDNRELIKES